VDVISDESQKRKMPDKEVVDDVYQLLVEYYKQLSLHCEQPGVYPAPVHPFNMSPDELVVGLKALS
jgi:hypothetical protein